MANADDAELARLEQVALELENTVKELRKQEKDWNEKNKALDATFDALYESVRTGKHSEVLKGGKMVEEHSDEALAYFKKSQEIVLQRRTSYDATLSAASEIFSVRGSAYLKWFLEQELITKEARDRKQKLADCLQKVMQDYAK